MRKTFWLLLMVFVVPVVLGTLLYWLNPNFSNQTTNYGTLVEPVVPINNEDINWLTTGSLSSKWTLLYIDDYCDEVCASNLQTIHTIYLLMNDKINRVQKVLVSAKAAELVDGSWLQARAINAPLAQGVLWIVDPLNNVMMQYSMDDLAVKKVVKDLNRLLKYSRIG